MATGVVIRPATAEESDVVADIVFGEPQQETLRVASALYGVDDAEVLRPLFRSIWRAAGNWRLTYIATVGGDPAGILQLGRSSMRLTPRIVMTAVRTLGFRALAAPRAMRLADRVAPPKPPGALVISELHVRGSHRGQGIGGQLLIFAEQEAARRGHQQLALHTFTTNPARRLYERHGYIATAEATDPAFERRTQTSGNVLFVKDIEPSA